MASRFEDVGDDLVGFVEDVQRDNFPALNSAVFRILYDTKKRRCDGKLVFARIKKASDDIKTLAADDNGISPDYIMYIDKNIWLVLSVEDKTRIVYHELCHCETNFESEDNPFKVRGHEIQTFYDEIEYNKEDPRWLERVSAIGEHVYDPDNNEAPSDTEDGE